MTPNETHQHIDQLEAHIDAGGKPGTHVVTDLIAIMRDLLEQHSDLERRFRNSRLALRRSKPND